MSQSWSMFLSVCCISHNRHWVTVRRVSVSRRLLPESTQEIMAGTPVGFQADFKVLLADLVCVVGHAPTPHCLSAEIWFCLP